MLQDSGVELTDTKAADLECGKKKHFKERILLGWLLHKYFLRLANMVYLTYQNDDKAGKYFTNLTKNKS